jgi:putative restriction endonuclease
MVAANHDTRVRQAAFTWLTEQVELHGDVLPRSVLAQGFTFDGNRVPLLGPQGIFKPRVLDMPLSITAIPSGPYDDGYTSDGLLLYRYRGTDPQHPDNAGLRKAMGLKTPLVYFHRVVEGKYLAIWPVFIVGDDPKALTFKVEVDDASFAKYDAPGEAVPLWVEDGRRAYITATVRQRVHQRSFRERVLQAYREQCALCRLRHEELLDAAHIIPDAEPEGEPRVSNGIALCKLHHAAFDKYFLAIRPDYVIEVRADILNEEDGPMLLHGLKGMHQQKLLLPRAVEHQPNPDLLEERYQRFLSAAGQ